MQCVIKDYNSPFFPVIVYWNNGNNASVFETIEKAKGHMIGRFGKVEFIDRREKK